MVWKRLISNLIKFSDLSNFKYFSPPKPLSLLFDYFPRMLLQFSMNLFFQKWLLAGCRVKGMPYQQTEDLFLASLCTEKLNVKIYKIRGRVESNLRLAKCKVELDIWKLLFCNLEIRRRFRNWKNNEVCLKTISMRRFTSIFAKWRVTFEKCEMREILQICWM